MSGIPESRKLESVQNAKARIGIEKKCSKCKKVKILEAFSFNKKGTQGRHSQCKECNAIDGKRSRANHHNDWQEVRRKKYNENPELRLEQNRVWCKNNPEARRKIVSRAHRKSRNIAKVKISESMSNGIRKSIIGKGNRHWELFVDFTIEQLKKHLEKRFKPEMTWANYGAWHIDHKIPITVFNFEKPEDFDFKRCWALKNLQPMWAKENMSKGAKIIKPFQPALPI